MVAAQSRGIYETIGRGISINDRGDIAYMGVTRLGHQLYCRDGETGKTASLMNPVFYLQAEGDAPSQTFSEFVEIDNFEIKNVKGEGYPQLSVRIDEVNRTAILTLTGSPGRHYRVQVSSDLVNWLDIAEPMDFSGIQDFVESFPTEASQRFYRVAR